MAADLKKIVLITGCAQGVGFTLANLLSNLDSYSVVGITREKVNKKLRRLMSERSNIRFVKMDVMSDENVTGLVDEVIEKEGQIDVLGKF